MTTKKTTALASALRDSGATVAAVPPPVVVEAVEPAKPAATKPQASRAGTAAITVHHPERVRHQLKILAAEQGRTVDDMVAEALNLLFAKYRKAEIAPRKA
jgi:hypothetical protein